MSTFEELPVTRQRDTEARYVTGAGVRRRLVFPFAGTGVGYEEMNVELLTDGRVLLHLPPTATALGRLVVDAGFFAAVHREFGAEPRP